MNRASRGFRVAFLVAFLGCGLTGCAPVSSAHPAMPLYRIGGRVTDANTGAALARCSVRIVNVTDSLQARSVNSEDDGGFAFDGLPSGKYLLGAERHGYLAQNYEEHGEFSTAIAVGPGLASENLMFKLVAESVLVGTVIDDAGEPVRGALVRLFGDRNSDGSRSMRAVQAVNTDDRGMYEITGIRPGAYFLVVTAQPWYAQGLHQGTAELGSQARALDVAYPTTFFPGVTEENAATPIPVKGGERLTADVALTAQPALKLHLSMPPLAPNDQLTVRLSPSLFGQAEDLPIQYAYAPDRSIDVFGILPGHYVATLSKMAPERQARGETNDFSMDISGDTPELSWDGATGYIAIAGRVTSAFAELPKQALMALTATHRQQPYVARLNDAGDFSFSVPPGSYQVIGEINGMYVASLKVTGASIAGNTLTVKTGDSPKLHVVAGSGYGEIEGTVLSGDKPMSAAMVLLAPVDPGNNEVLFRRDQSDSDGTFTLANIVPGRYNLLAIERGWELEWANPSVLDTLLPKSLPIQIRAMDHLKQSVQVQAP